MTTEKIEPYKIRYSNPELVLPSDVMHKIQLKVEKALHEEDLLRQKRISQEKNVKKELIKKQRVIKFYRRKLREAKMHNSSAQVKKYTRELNRILNKATHTSEAIFY